MSVRSLVAASFATAALSAVAAAPARAQVFDFESTAQGVTTPFSITNGGVTATFTTTSPANGFEVVNIDGAFKTFAGNALFTPTSLNPVAVAFSRSLASVSFNFGTNGPTTLNLRAFLGATLVGSTSLAGAVSAGFPFPEGVLAFGGAAFDNISIVAGNPATQFAIDNVTVRPVADVVPEPATAALFGVGAAGLAATARRRRRTA